MLPQDDKRGRFEFWLPLVFYLFAWMNFFMTIPRPWTPLQKQNTPEQKNDIARPSATGNREKAGAIIAAIAWVVICISLGHSLKHYKPKTVGIFNKINAFCRDCPTKIFLALILLAIRIGYGIASAWIWDLSIFQDEVQIGWPFGLGFGPILLILLVFEIAGFVEENEDKQLQAQRRERGQMYDQELGIVHKPSWWSRNWAARYQTDEERLKNMTAETSGGRTTGRSREQNIELGNMNIRNRSRSRPADDPFRDQSPDSRISSATDAPPPPYHSSMLDPNVRPAPRRMESDAASTATGFTGQTLTSSTEAANPQRVRSMLDL